MTTVMERYDNPATLTTTITLAPKFWMLATPRVLAAMKELQKAVDEMMEGEDT